jgi:hypothetical protein
MRKSWRTILNYCRFLIKEYDKDRFGESNFSNWNMIEELDNHEDE